MHSYFQSHNKDGGLAIRSTVAKNPMLHANFTTLWKWSYWWWRFHTDGIKLELLLNAILRCGNTHWRPFAPMTFTLTFIYELDPYSLEIHRMCKYELPMLNLSKVIIRHTYIHTDRQTRPKLDTMPLRGWSIVVKLMAYLCRMRLCIQS